MGNDTGFAEHSSLGYFFIFVFSMHESIGGGEGGGGVLYRSRLFEMHPPGLHLCRYDFSSYPPRGSVYKNIFRLFIFTHDAGSCNKIRILQMNN